MSDVTNKEPLALVKPRGSRFLDPVNTMAEICTQIATGRTVKAVCEEKGVSMDQIAGWCARSPELSMDWARARCHQAHSMAEDAVAIADEQVNDIAQAQRNRLRVDTRKWLASKVAPRIYGEKVFNELTGADGGPIQVQVQVWKIGGREIQF